MNPTNSPAEKNSGPAQSAAAAPAAVAQPAGLPRTMRKRIAVSAYIVLPVAVLAVLSAPKIAADGAAAMALGSLGWVLFFLYSFIRFWSTLYIGSRKARELQTDGPYSICRNPLYLGSFCFALAVAVLLASLSLLVAILVVGLIYRFSVIPREEAMLRSIFGSEFDRYAARTPRLWPRLRLFAAGETLQVNMRGIQREARYQLFSLFLMLLLVALCHLRYQPWWPHCFNLP